MHIKSNTRNNIALIFLKKHTNTLAGFEPGSSVPKGDAMSTAQRHLFLVVYV
jgi:hypothetical protein